MPPLTVKKRARPRKQLAGKLPKPAQVQAGGQTSQPLASPLKLRPQPAPATQPAAGPLKLRPLEAAPTTQPVAGPLKLRSPVTTPFSQPIKQSGPVAQQPLSSPSKQPVPTTKHAETSSEDVEMRSPSPPEPTSMYIEVPDRSRGGSVSLRLAEDDPSDTVAPLVLRMPGADAGGTVAKATPTKQAAAGSSKSAEAAGGTAAPARSVPATPEATTSGTKPESPQQIAGASSTPTQHGAARPSLVAPQPVPATPVAPISTSGSPLTRMPPPSTPRQPSLSSLVYSFFFVYVSHR